MECSKYETCLNAGKKCGECTAISDIYNHYPLFKDKNTIDKHTALRIFRDISNKMWPPLVLFGDKTICINQNEFEMIRKKYLGEEEE